jgi:MFS family permease
MMKTLREVLQGNLLIFIVGDMLRQLSVFITFPYFSLYIQAIGGNVMEIGLVNSLPPLAALFVYPVAGYLADRCNRVKIIVVSSGISALVYIMFMVAPEWRVLAAANLCIGLLAFQFPAMNALMADSLPASQRGIGYSLWIAIPTVVGIAAPYLGGSLITYLGVEPAMRVLYALSVATATGITLMNHRCLRDSSRQERDDALNQRGIRIIKASYRDVVSVLQWLPRQLKAFTVMLMLTFFVNNLVAPYWVIYGVEQLGFSELQWGILLLFVGIISVTLLIPAGLIVDRYNIQRVLMVAQLLTLVPIALFPFIHTFLDAILLFVVMTVANVFLTAGAPTLMAHTVPPDKRGRVMAVLGQGMLFINMRGGSGGPGMGAVLTLPSILGALLGGVLYTVSPMLPWLVFSLVIAMNTVITLRFLVADA